MGACLFALVVCSVNTVVAQGPIRKAFNELNKVKADYPGPITYSPNDPAFRSDRFRMQTGHFGYFYNCDGEEDKRNSPYICWNSQHNADWRNGACNALKKDRCDIRQRLLDGSCATCSCNSCSECAAAQQGIYYADGEQPDELMDSARAVVAGNGARLKPINSAILNSENDLQSQLDAERAQLAEQLKRVEEAQKLVESSRAVETVEAAKAVTNTNNAAATPIRSAKKFNLFQKKRR